MFKVNGLFITEEDFIKDAEAAALNAFCETLASRYTKENTVANFLLASTIFVKVTKYGEKVYAGNDNGYDYYVQIDDDIVKIFENKKDYHNVVESVFHDISSFADNLRYLYD